MRKAVLAGSSLGPESELWSPRLAPWVPVALLHLSLNPLHLAPLRDTVLPPVTSLFSLRCSAAHYLISTVPTSVPDLSHHLPSSATGNRLAESTILTSPRCLRLPQLTPRCRLSRPHRFANDGVDPTTTVGQL